MGVSLLTMGAGNVIVLEETIKSMLSFCDEIVYGDMLLFPEDREVLAIYEKKYNMRVVRFPFNYIFKHGFGVFLNDLSKYAKNDMCCYMNTSEKIEINYGATEIMRDNPDCNAFYFTHKTESHRWYRTYNRKDLHWSGCIHEQLTGEYRPYHKPIFQMMDLEKDMYSDFKAWAFNSVKEIVYFKQYMRLVDDPESMGETDISWLNFSRDGYNSFKERLEGKGNQYKAFLNGDYPMLIEALFSKPMTGNERFKSNQSIEYQGDPAYLGKIKQ